MTTQPSVRRPSRGRFVAVFLVSAGVGLLTAAAAVAFGLAAALATVGGFAVAAGLLAVDVP